MIEMGFSTGNFLIPGALRKVHFTGVPTNKLPITSLGAEPAK